MNDAQAIRLINGLLVALDQTSMPGTPEAYALAEAWVRERETMDARQRVVEELAQLDERITRLEYFLAGDASRAVSELQRNLLRAQVHAMWAYKTILDTRLRAWQ